MSFKVNRPVEVRGDHVAEVRRVADHVAIVHVEGGSSLLVHLKDLLDIEWCGTLAKPSRKEHNTQ